MGWSIFQHRGQIIWFFSSGCRECSTRLLQDMLRAMGARRHSCQLNTVALLSPVQLVCSQKQGETVPSSLYSIWLTDAMWVQYGM